MTRAEVAHRSGLTAKVGLPGLNELRLASHFPDFEGYPTWSLDGRSIAYLAD
jgi:hypothetical protein